MTFRPVDDAFIRECYSQPSCAMCPLREGCYYRYMFYRMSAEQLFKVLGSTEAMLSSWHAEAKLAHNVSTLMKTKYIAEHAMYPHYSYK